MRREEVLEYETRRRVFELIQREPGLHMRELERRSTVPLSTLRHHLAFLQEHGLVDAEEDRNVTRFFPRALLEPHDRRTLGALRQEALRRLLLHILAKGGQAPYRELAAEHGIPASTLATYLAELVRRGVLARRSLGRESRYDVLEPERVIRLLLAYRETFFDRLVDHLLDAVYQDEP